jgi:hypothetical protein
MLLFIRTDVHSGKKVERIGNTAAAVTLSRIAKNRKRLTVGPSTD